MQLGGSSKACEPHRPDCGHNAIKQLRFVALQTIIIIAHVYVAAEPQWEPLCASAIWNEECHSVLPHWLSGGETKCHFVPPQHSSTNRHRRTPILLRSALPLSPPTHLLSSDCTCAPLHHSHVHPRAHADVSFHSSCTNHIFIYMRTFRDVYRGVFLSTRHTHTHVPCTHNWVLTASDTWLQVMP